MNTCFAIMPFDDRFNDIADIVRRAAAECGLEYVRGDLSGRSGSILPEIVHEIRRAGAIVADITDHNPNVFYELGIAHQIAGPDRVVIITQAVDGKKAYDVHQFRQLTYSHNANGRKKLRSELPRRLREAMAAAADREFWNIVRGRLPRTRMIVRDLKKLVDEAGKSGLSSLTIRTAASLGSLAISDHEPPDSRLGTEYFEALLEERDSLRAALLGGARLKAVLNPPRRFSHVELPASIHMRYRRLIGLLKGRSDIRNNPNAAKADTKAIRNCRIALSPIPTQNLFIIGDKVAYEGMKRAGSSGFEVTHCETNSERVQELVQHFDQMFEASKPLPNRELLEHLEEFYREFNLGHAPGTQKTAKSAAIKQKKR